MTQTPMDVLDWCDRATWDALTAQRNEFEEAGGAQGHGMAHTLHKAIEKAREYVEYGSAYADFQPGNMTSYRFALIDLYAAQGDYFARRAWEAKIEETRTFEQHQAARAAGRLKAKHDHVGPADQWGGDLLVVPIGKKAVAVGMPWFLHHTSVQEWFGYRYPDAVPVAEFLSLFGAAVQHIIQRREET